MRAEAGELLIYQFHQQDLLGEGGARLGQEKVGPCWPAVSSGPKGTLAVASP